MDVEDIEGVVDGVTGVVGLGVELEGEDKLVEEIGPGPLESEDIIY